MTGFMVNNCIVEMFDKAVYFAKTIGEMETEGRFVSLRPEDSRHIVWLRQQVDACRNHIVKASKQKEPK